LLWTPLPVLAVPSLQAKRFIPVKAPESNLCFISSLPLSAKI
jgi:hypothetical protein